MEQTVMLVTAQTEDFHLEKLFTPMPDILHIWYGPCEAVTMEDFPQRNITGPTVSCLFLH